MRPEQEKTDLTYPILLLGQAVRNDHYSVWSTAYYLVLYENVMKFSLWSRHPVISVHGLIQCFDKNCFNFYPP